VTVGNVIVVTVVDVAVVVAGAVPAVTVATARDGVLPAVVVMVTEVGSPSNVVGVAGSGPR
jgi:hypothetical protein